MKATETVEFFIFEADGARSVSLECSVEAAGEIFLEKSETIAALRLGVSSWSSGNHRAEVCLSDFDDDWIDGVGYDHVNLSRYLTDKSSYWAAKEAFDGSEHPRRKICDAIFRHSRDLLSRLFSLCDVVATDNGVKLNPFVLRKINEAPLHADVAKIDATEWEFSRQLHRQYAWNICLSAPDSGGETVIFRNNRQCRDASFTASSKVASTRITPREMTLLVFSSENYHMVERSQGAASRIMLGGFCASEQPPSNRLIFWA